MTPTQLPLNMSDYNQLSSPVCRPMLLPWRASMRTRWDSEMFLAIDTTKSSGPDGISGSYYAEMNSCQHCSWNYTKLMNMQFIQEDSLLQGKHLLYSNPERKLCIKLAIGRSPCYLKAHLQPSINLYHPIALQQWGFSQRNLQCDCLPLLMLYTNDQKPLTKVVKYYVLFSFICRRNFSDSSPHKSLIDKS